MVQANLNRPLVPSFGVKLNGEPMAKSMEPWVGSLRVDEEVDVPGMFELQLVSRDDRDGVLPWVDDERLELSALLELSLGYEAQLDTVIVGEITDLEPVFSTSGPPQLLVRGQDRRHLLNGAPHTQSFEGRKYSDIVEMVVGARMAIEATDSGVKHDYVSQTQETDLAFLQRLARSIGFELVMKRDTLLFRPRANDGAVMATLTFDDDLLEFRPHLTLLPVTQVTMLGWSVQEKGVFAARADVDDQASTMGKRFGTEHARIALGGVVDMVMRASVASQAELDQLAAARVNATALDYIRADGRCRGRTDVRAGTVIRIDGIGSRFSGRYYVTSASHSYTAADGYTTSFQLRRNAT